MLIPASSLLPDGSMRTPAGIRALCLAARVHAVPGRVSSFAKKASDVFSIARDFVDLIKAVFLRLKQKRASP